MRLLKTSVLCYTIFMNRNTSLEALVLSTKPMGENNRLATVLTPDRGILTAVVYGGRKGKLRSSVSPYHSGTMWLYIDSVKQSIKITDFDPEKCRSEIRNNLYKTYAAALACELVIMTQGFATHVVDVNHFEDSHELYILINGFLDGLDFCSESQARLGTLRFLWRFLSHLGVQSDVSRCMHCGENMISCYSVSEHLFVCNDCSFSSHDVTASRDIALSSESIEYLQSIMDLHPKDVRSLHLSIQSVQEIHELLFFLIQQTVPSKLKTLDAGKGIL